MNKSPRIDPSNCRKCGKCCKAFEVYYTADDKKGMNDMVYISLRSGMDARISPYPGGWRLTYNHPCKHLIDDGEGYRCKIYDLPERPPLCALFPYPDSDEEDCPHILPNPKITRDLVI